MRKAEPPASPKNLGVPDATSWPAPPTLTAEIATTRAHTSARQPRRLPERNGYATSTVACTNGNATSEVTTDRMAGNLKGSTD